MPPLALHGQVLPVNPAAQGTTQVSGVKVWAWQGPWGRVPGDVDTACPRPPYQALRFPS